MIFLQAQEWRGNIRALRRAIRRGITNCVAREAEALCIDDFEVDEPHYIASKPSPTQLRQTKRESLPGLLAHYQGNISQVSRELGISRLTIRRWIEADGLNKEIHDGNSTNHAR